jgi:hypothetical protein
MVAAGLSFSVSPIGDAGGDVSEGTDGGTLLHPIMATRSLAACPIGLISAGRLTCSSRRCCSRFCIFVTPKTFSQRDASRDLAPIGPCTPFQGSSSLTARSAHFSNEHFAIAQNDYAPTRRTIRHLRGHAGWALGKIGHVIPKRDGARKRYRLEFGPGFFRQS